jgi:anti-sigma B factor antagonist
MIMEFTIKEDASTITITVRGQMELNSIKEFQNKVIELGAASPRDIILDIKDVEYIDSTGISVLITLNRQQKQNGKSLTITNASQRVANLLELSSLSDLLQS